MVYASLTVDGETLSYFVCWMMLGIRAVCALRIYTWTNFESSERARRNTRSAFRRIYQEMKHDLTHLRCSNADIKIDHQRADTPAAPDRHLSSGATTAYPHPASSQEPSPACLQSSPQPQGPRRFYARGISPQAQPRIPPARIYCPGSSAARVTRGDRSPVLAR